MDTRHRWLIIIGALLLAAGVGYFAYNAGFSTGLEESGKLAAAPPYHWHHHWGFGWFFPFFILACWLFAFRGLRGHHRYHCRYEEDRPRS